MLKEGVRRARLGNHEHSAEKRDMTIRQTVHSVKINLLGWTRTETKEN